MRQNAIFFYCKKWRPCPFTVILKSKFYFNITKKVMYDLNKRI